MSQAMRYSQAGVRPVCSMVAVWACWMAARREDREAARAQALEVVSDGDHRHRHRLAHRVPSLKLTRSLPSHGRYAPP